MPATSLTEAKFMLNKISKWMIFETLILLGSSLDCYLLANTLKQPRIIKIALVFDYSGRWTEVSDIEDGLALASADASSQGIQFSFERFDSKENGIGTVKAMEKAVSSMPDIIVAEIHSSKAAVAAIQAEQKHRVMITPLATSPSVTEGKSFVFRACFNDSFQGAGLARFARRERAASSVAIVSDVTQLYSRTLAESFKREFLAQGGSVIAEEKILPTTTSFVEVIKSIAAKKPDMVFLPLYEQSAARIISESMKSGEDRLRFLGGDGWAASNALRDLVFKGSNKLDASWVSHYSGDFSQPALANAQKRLKILRNAELNGASAIGYDTGLIITRAFLQLGKKYSQEELVQAIHKIPNISGLTGDFSFGLRKDPAKSIFIRRVLNHGMAKYTEVKP
jgi:branched-chain amino acid transport system substrate-binding protein